MLYENKELDRAFEFIKNSNFDVFCIQEVSEEFLARLKSLPYSISYINEIKLTSAIRSFPVHSVILSKYPITKQEEIAFTDFLPPIRKKIIRYILSLLHTEKIIKRENRTSFFADIQTDFGPMRIFNLHLPLSYPMQRIKELKESMTNYNPENRTIICGDFNILETFYISVLNWLLGGRLSDWIFHNRERKYMEEYFKKLGFSNPLYRHVTHPLSQSQLDHILVPSPSVIKSVYVGTNRLGSDHCPIRIEADL